MVKPAVLLSDFELDVFYYHLDTERTEASQSISIGLGFQCPIWRC